MNPELAITALIGFVSALMLPSTGAKLFGLWIGIFFAGSAWLADSAPLEDYPGQYDGEGSTHL